MDITSKNSWLVAYDVCDSKRLARVRSRLLGFGDPVQLSVFRCELTPSEVVELRTRLSDAIDVRKDRVLFANIGPSSGRGSRAIFSLGCAPAPLQRGGMVI